MTSGQRAVPALPTQRTTATANACANATPSTVIAKGAGPEAAASGTTTLIL